MCYNSQALGICVKVAQQTLTLYVWVRILDPQPKQKADLDGRLFVLAGGLSRSDGGIGDFTFLGGRADPSPTVCELIVYRLKQNKLMKNSGKIVEFFIELWYNIINYM